LYFLCGQFFPLEIPKNSTKITFFFAILLCNYVLCCYRYQSGQNEDVIVLDANQVLCFPAGRVIRGHVMHLLGQHLPCNVSEGPLLLMASIVDLEEN